MTRDASRPSWEREGLVALNAAAAVIDAAQGRGRPGHGCRRSTTRSWRCWAAVAPALPRAHPALRPDARPPGARGGPRPRRASVGPRCARRGAGRGRRGHHGAHHAGASRRGFGPEGQAWVARARAEHLRLAWLAGVGRPGPGRAADRLAGRGRRLRARSATPSRRPGPGPGWPPSWPPQRRHRGRLARCGRRRARSPSAGRRAAARRAGHRAGGPPVGRTRRGRTGRAARPEAGTSPRGSGRSWRWWRRGAATARSAKALFISTKTVSVHVSNILAKLGAAGRTEAAAIARRDGLLG